MNDTNAFLGKTVEPTENEVASALGPAQPVWKELLTWLRDEQQLPDKEWTSYSPKYGWALRIKRTKRNSLYLSPARDCFLVSFILGDKAVEALRAGKLSKALLKTIDEAPLYPEGTGLRFLVSKSSQLSPIRQLTLGKLAH